MLAHAAKSVVKEATLAYMHFRSKSQEKDINTSVLTDIFRTQPYMELRIVALKNTVLQTKLFICMNCTQ